MNPSFSVRFFIGLHVATQPPGEDGFENRPVAVESRAFRAIAILSARYPFGLTVARGSGIWRGGTEPNIVAEAIIPVAESRSKPTFRSVSDEANAVAFDIAMALDQECVAFSVATVDFFRVAPGDGAIPQTDADVRRFISGDIVA
jgi:hypothetical protein